MKKTMKKTLKPGPFISGVTFQHTDGRRAEVAIALAKAVELNAEAIIAISKLGSAPSMLSVSDSTGLVVSDCNFKTGEGA